MIEGRKWTALRYSVWNIGNGYTLIVRQMNIYQTKD